MRSVPVDVARVVVVVIEVLARDDVVREIHVLVGDSGVDHAEGFWGECLRVDLIPRLWRIDIRAFCTADILELAVDEAGHEDLPEVVQRPLLFEEGIVGQAVCRVLARGNGKLDAWLVGNLIGGLLG